MEKKLLIPLDRFLLGQETESLSEVSAAKAVKPVLPPTEVLCISDAQGFVVTAALEQLENSNGNGSRWGDIPFDPTQLLRTAGDIRAVAHRDCANCLRKKGDGNEECAYREE